MTEQELDLERKRLEDLRRIQSLRLLDDDFMNKVFEDKACAEFLLQIILERTDLTVQKVHSQHNLKNLQGRSVRLDILATDEAGRVYNIEVQRSDKGAGAKRVRYFKEEQEGVATMSRIFEEIKREAAQEAARKTAREK